MRISPSDTLVLVQVLAGVGGLFFAVPPIHADAPGPAAWGTLKSPVKRTMKTSFLHSLEHPRRWRVDAWPRALVLLILFSVIRVHSAQVPERVDVWPGLAPGETTRQLGRAQPFRKNEVPPVVRMEQITRPTFTVHLAPEPNGAVVLVLPGGGFGKVVTNKEGTEAAAWLHRQGVSACVLSYRTRNAPGESGWKKALQDAQRALSLIRQRAPSWGLKPDGIGLLGFSAGGQVAARLLGSEGKGPGLVGDAIDQVSCRPDFALLVYPWNLYDTARDALFDGITVPASCPPTFLLHTDDDPSSSLGAILFYAGLKRHGIPAEIHVYGNGGHGYGLREVQGSRIHTWPRHAGHWLQGVLENTGQE
jgi:acetyl esterase/lipase